MVHPGFEPAFDGHQGSGLELLGHPGIFPQFCLGTVCGSALIESVGVVCLVAERGFRGREVEGIEIGEKYRLGGEVRLAPVETLGRIDRFAG